MINLQNMQVKNGSTWQKICPFPVGFVYSSYTNTSPGSTFGGTWTPITGRFPYYNNGVGTGGSNTHTLTVNEMPSHKHGINIPAGTAGGGSGLWLSNLTTHINDPITADGYVQHTGGGASHNNMPAYQTLYAWRRTA